MAERSHGLATRVTIVEGVPPSKSKVAPRTLQSKDTHISKNGVVKHIVLINENMDARQGPSPVISEL